MIKQLLLAVLIAPVSLAHADDVVFAGGCFWCVEADFESVPGVREVTSGYTGGHTRNPTYLQVARGRTGHYEAVRVEYDPEQISRAELYRLFFRAIDPLDSRGQFCDRGSAYRSAIFVSGSADRRDAEAARDEARAILGHPIATQILPRGPFYEAEDYHQDYYKSGTLTWRRILPSSRSSAYEFYREACGRDARTRQIWGDQAVFAHE